MTSFDKRLIQLKNNSI